MSLTPEQLKAFLEAPSSPTPEGVVRNLDKPDNSNDEAMALGVICIVFSTAAILARAYSRLFVIKSFRIEDYLGIGAFLPYIPVMWCYFHFRNKAGFFVHQWDLRGYILADIGLIAFILGICYSLMMLMLKTAILIEWVRIFVPDRKRNIFYWASAMLIFINVGAYASAIFTTFAGCRPLEKVWHFWVPGVCIDRKNRDIVNAALNLMIDLFILVLPQKTIWRLQMTKRRKMAVSVVFSIGILTVALAAGRLHSMIILPYSDKDKTVPFDTTYVFSQTLMWVSAECTCIFLVFCVPAMPKLFLDQGIVSRLAASFRSWTRLSRPSSPRGSPSTSSAHKASSIPGTPRSGRSSSKRAYGIIDDDDSQHKGSLTELAVMRNKYVETHGGSVDGNTYSHGGGDDEQVLTGITKIVEFDRRDDAASRASADPHKRQHPWMAER